MRGRSGPVSESKFELKTLKVSNDTLNAIRAPIVWNRPTAGMFDYHYDLAGLYYQPMINYCQEREEGGARRVVDLPDRLESNFDKRAYTRGPDEGDYDKFLTMMYQRRMKDKNAKSIHVANERWARSKANTTLNTIRGADNARDRYLCQIQLIHTGRVAQGRELGAGSTWQHEGKATNSSGYTYEMKQSGNSGAVETTEYREERERRSLSAEPVLQKRTSDPKYGPGFNRISKYESRPLSAGGSGLELVGIKEPELPPVSFDYVGKKTEEACQKYEEYISRKEMEQAFMNADTVEDFLKHQTQLQQKRDLLDKKDYKPLYNDTSYVRALGDVQKRIKDSGRYKGMQPSLDDINIFYRRRRIEDIGAHEKAAIRTAMYKGDPIPDFDIGYATVHRDFCPKV